MFWLPQNSPQVSLLTHYNDQTCEKQKPLPPEVPSSELPRNSGSFFSFLIWMQAVIDHTELGYYMLTDARACLYTGNAQMLQPTRVCWFQSMFLEKMID